MRASPSRIAHIWLIVNDALEDLFYLPIGNPFNRFVFTTRMKKLDPAVACRVSLPKVSRSELKVRFRTTN
ncbi:MAG: hypothetical protein WBC89_05840 [Dehalococcoidia bacterium]